MTQSPIEPFPVTRVAHIQQDSSAPSWLVENLWAHQAVGFIGGTPKSGKTWLALELAVAVASGRPCLSTFPVHQRGHVLLYAAEDSASAIKQRVSGLCESRHIPNLERLPIGLITFPNLRLDLAEHQQRLDATISHLKPRLLILDPFVRLHLGDENSACEISALLGTLRHLQRTYNLAIILVHHVRKSAASQPGQSLRGSGDLHAWADSSLYLLRRKDRLELHVEHRSHQAAPPVVVQLASSPAPHLAITGTAADPSSAEPTDDPEQALQTQILAALAHQPMTRTALRDLLHIRNQRLGAILSSLHAQGRLLRTDGLLAVPTS